MEPGRLKRAVARVSVPAWLPGRVVHVAADAATTARSCGPCRRRDPAAASRKRGAVRPGAAAHRAPRRPPHKGDRSAPPTASPPPPPGRRPRTADGREQVRHVAEVTGPWYGSDTRTVRLTPSRDEHTASGYDLALVTTDLTAAPGALVAVTPPGGHRAGIRRRPQRPGAGEARNRVRLAVERTVPFALLVHTLIIIWYARHGHDPADIDDRRASQPGTGPRQSPPSRTCSSSSAGP